MSLNRATSPHRHWDIAAFSLDNLSATFNLHSYLAWKAELMRPAGASGRFFLPRGASQKAQARGCSFRLDSRRAFRSLSLNEPLPPFNTSRVNRHPPHHETPNSSGKPPGSQPLETSRTNAIRGSTLSKKVRRPPTTYPLNKSS